MKLRILAVAAAALILGAAAATTYAADPSTSGEAAVKAAETVDPAAPKAQFPERGFIFEPVVDGASVTHDFVVKNTGDGPLAIRNVKTG